MRCRYRPRRAAPALARRAPGPVAAAPRPMHRQDRRRRSPSGGDRNAVPLQPNPGCRTPPAHGRNPPRRTSRPVTVSHSSRVKAARSSTTVCSPRGGHVPVVPVVARPAERDVLVRVIGAVAYREHYQPCGGVMAQPAGIGHRPRAPVMANQHRLVEAQCVDEIQQVAPQRGELTAAWSQCIAKACLAAAQRRAEHAVARCGQTLGHGSQPSGQSGQPCTSTATCWPRGSIRDKRYPARVC